METTNKIIKMLGLMLVTAVTLDLGAMENRKREKPDDADDRQAEDLAPKRQNMLTNTPEDAANNVHDLRQQEASSASDDSLACQLNEYRTAQKLKELEREADLVALKQDNIQFRQDLNWPDPQQLNPTGFPCLAPDVRGLIAVFVLGDAPSKQDFKDLENMELLWGWGCKEYEVERHGNFEYTSEEKTFRSTACLLNRSIVLKIPNAVVTSHEKWASFLNFLTLHPNLRVELDLAMTAVTCEQLAELPNVITSLNLERCVHIHEGAFNLKNLTQLTSLNLSSTQLTGDQVTNKNLPGSLTELNLESCAHIHEGDFDLTHLTRLTNLNLSGTQLTGDQVTNKNLPGSLTKLDLYWCAHIHEGDFDLTHLTRLTNLSLTNTRLTGDQVTNNLPASLTELDLCWCDHIHEGAFNLKNLTQLEQIVLNFSFITVEQLANIPSTVKIIR